MHRDPAPRPQEVAHPLQNRLHMNPLLSLVVYLVFWLFCFSTNPLKSVNFDFVFCSNFFSGKKSLDFETLVARQLNDASLLFIFKKVSIASKVLGINME